jgi:hypothetical protein
MGIHRAFSYPEKCGFGTISEVSAEEDEEVMIGCNFKVMWIAPLILTSDDPGESLKETVVTNCRNSTGEGS